MAHIGHPVAGDYLYGGEAPWLINRQALHASRLIFRHPVTNEKIDLTAPLPADILEVIEKIK
jgi:23S rRNA pseudouridine1911/1915/1917 synthase